MVERKTAVLISAASELGAILGDREGEEREALRAFGFLLGIAFQLMDDALDYVADERLFGKMTGNDLTEGKVTLPLIWTLRACRPSERETINAVLKSEQLDLDDFRAIAALIRHYGGIEGTITRAQEYVAQGRRPLVRQEIFLEPIGTDIVFAAPRILRMELRCNLVLDLCLFLLAGGEIRVP